jgi:hypothetical protein
MEQFKSPFSRLARLFKKSRDAWKQKALERQQKIRALEVRIRDLEESRERWKRRAQQVEEEKKQEAEAAREAGKEEPPSSLCVVAGTQPPAGHHYPLLTIQRAIQMVVGALISRRAVEQVFELFDPLAGTGLPAYTTIQSWVYRFGLYLLQQPVAVREDWIFIADHTVQLGPLKCLVILGIPVAHLGRAGYSPNHQDMTVLEVKVMATSTGQLVEAILEEVSSRVGVPRLLVADEGPDVRKGMERFIQRHTQTLYLPDVSHWLANLLKAHLANEEGWAAFLAACHRCRARLQQTPWSFLLPSEQRAKARYMHLEAFVEWAPWVLAYYDHGDFSLLRPAYSLDWATCHWIAQQGGNKEVDFGLFYHEGGVCYPNQASFRTMLGHYLGAGLDTLDESQLWPRVDERRRDFLDRFGWLLTYRQALQSYASLFERVKLTQTLLKQEGIRADSQSHLEAQFAALPTPEPRVQAFTEQILARVGEQGSQLAKGEALLASSDILESGFGKLKLFAKRCPLNEIGQQVLLIPTFFVPPTLQRVKEAMESIRNADVKAWCDKHLGLSALAKRLRARRVLNKTQKVHEKYLPSGA